MNLIEQLKRHEGFESDYYQCTADKRTIGYGRNVDDNPFSKAELEMLGREDFDIEPMTEDEAEELLVNDVNSVIDKIKPLLPWAELCPSRQAVCANMAFNLGTYGFSKFKKMIAALHDKAYAKAAVEMLDSRWAEQVYQRASDLSWQMKDGEWK